MHIRVFRRLYALGAALLAYGCSGGATIGGSVPSIGGGSSTPAASPSAAAPATSAPVSASVPFAATPDTDPFYAAPSPFPSVAPGTILRSRAVVYQPGGQTQPAAGSAWQLLFASRDIHGSPIAAANTVVLPAKPAAITAVVSEQIAEDSLGAACAPSHVITGGSSDPNMYEQANGPTLDLEQGWILIVPDHEGPLGLFLVGQAEGQITLDSIRAAKSFAPLGITASTPIGMSGYSGGAHATAWAAALQPSYAPELHITAVAPGGTPADPIAVNQEVDTNTVDNMGGFAKVFASMYAINRVYPNFLSPILNAKGIAAGLAMANGCIGNTTDGSAQPAGHIADYTTVTDPLNSAGVVANKPALLLPQPGHAPVANMFIYHSQTDEVVPIGPTDAMVSAWCSQGVPIQYFRGYGTHVSFAASTAAQAEAYLTARFAGTTPVFPAGTSNCNV